MHHAIKLIVLCLAIAALLSPLLPSFAQDTPGFDYRMDGLELGMPGAPAALQVAADHTEFQLAAISVELRGAMRCIAADQTCLDRGLDGQKVTLTTASDLGQPRVADGTSHTLLFGESLVSNLTAGGQAFGPFSSHARGRLTCDGTACQVQVVVCSTGGAPQLGLVLNGSLTASDTLPHLMEQEGISWFEWKDLGGTAYLTQPDAPNPICGGRDLDALYADEYIPQLPSQAADPAVFQLPEAGTDRIDQDLVIEATTALFTDQGIRIGVRGYFFGQCGVDPQVRVSDDTDIVHGIIYRDIPDGKTCTGGVESFSLRLPHIETGAVYRTGDRLTININGQIIAILIGL